LTAGSATRSKGGTGEAEQILARYRWPGNFCSFVERAMLLAAGDKIAPEELMTRGADLEPSANSFQLPADGVQIEEVERSPVTEALERTGSRRSRAARLLGLTRDQVRHRTKMKRYGPLDKPAEVR